MSLIADLTTAPGPGAVLSGALVPDGAVSDASEIGRQRPIILLRPASTAEVSAARRSVTAMGRPWCHKAG